MFFLPVVKHEYISNFNINSYLEEKYEDITEMYDNLKEKYKGIKLSKIIIFGIIILLIYNQIPL